MRRRMLRIGLLTAVALVVSPISGTAGAGVAVPDSVNADVEATLQVDRKCVVVNDVGDVGITIKTSKKDQGTTVGAAIADKVVVCLAATAEAEAHAELTLHADVQAGADVDCGDGAGAGANVFVLADVAVSAGFQAWVSVTVDVFASTGDQTYGEKYEDWVGHGADEDTLAPEVTVDFAYCKTVGLEDGDGKTA